MVGAKMPHECACSSLRPVAAVAMVAAVAGAGAGLTSLFAALLFLALGKDPLRGLSIFLVEPLSNMRQISEVVLKATPLIVIALGLAVCYRSNVWNIGAEGQFLLGVLSGGGVALWLTTSGIVLPKIIAVPLVLAAACSAAWPGPASRRCCATSSMPARSWSA